MARFRRQRLGVANAMALLSATCIAMALALVPTARAQACVCMSAPEAAQFAAADIVFIGVVAFKEDFPARGEEEQAFANAFYTFAVEERLKGLNRRVRVGVAASGVNTSCGLAFQLGERWRIYAVKGDSFFGTGMCAANELLDADAPVPDIEPLPLPVLAEQEPAPTPSPAPEPAAGVSLAPIAFGAAAMALIVGLSIVAFWRGRSHDTAE